MDIKGYKIHRKIGEGAMAGVFLAEQESLGRKVALKVLSPALAGQGGFTERFLKEGKIIAYLKHPQIVSVYDLGSSNHNYYLAMEFLPGGTLEQRICKGLSAAQSVRHIIKISEALSFAHNNGVIHRDIKSQNIMFRQDDIPVLTDFGIARLMDNDPELTIPGRTMGSPLFMSPEQICGGSLDARADLYSVGILFYKMLTNKLPYQSDHILTIALMHKTAPLPVLPDALSMFQPVLDRLLAKAPDQRYSSAQELIDALKQIESEPAYQDLAPHPYDGHIRPAIQMAPLEPFNLPGVEPSGHNDDATQPALGPSSGVDDTEQRTGEKTVPRDMPEEGAQEVLVEPPIGSKGKRVGKIGSVLVAAMLVLTVGIFAVDTYSSKSDEALRQPPAASLHRARIDDPLHLAQELEPAPAKGQDHQEHEVSPPGEDHQAVASSEPKSDLPASDRFAVNKKIESLMAKAQRQLAENRLTLPLGDNCYETYQQLLSLDPTGQKAESLLAKIGQAYGGLAMATKEKGKLHQSLILVDKGLTLLPKDTVLLAMRDDLRMKLAERDRIKQEQALRIELQKIKRAAELASIERKREAERQLEAQRRQEDERARLKESMTISEIQEPQKVNVDVKPPEPAEKKMTDKRKRLYGTF